MFTDFDRELLMAVQYELPLTDTPFLDLAYNLDVPQSVVISKLREFKEKGVIKRIGANLNYKAFGMIGKAALVAFACDEKDVERIAGVINSSIERISLKHNYLRDHPVYKIWFTFKGRSVEDMRRRVERLAKACGVSKYLFLPSKRVYKMDVKYDLYKGISWSRKGLERENVPKVEELGIDAKMLFELERMLPIDERPFRDVARRYGMGEEEIVDLIHELIRKGVVRDFSGVLKERAIGFTENGMNLVKTDDPQGTALKIAKRFPEVTHLVEREVPEGWEYPIYFMVHADSRGKIEAVRRRVESMLGVEVLTLYSLRDLGDVNAELRRGGKGCCRAV